ncbi:spindle and kinetochore-associated protein 3 isoform X2 [Chelmon rostratus]|uniref:spindle and kinetochore-associated protein 3 isoform X2 n=1 Tax=Chelmon rostratus TaxID=109905 RepID=UPI001BE6A368|nr:spindle and kinetochore-associated protein 3 isoform X2 [Chelmon rostratus]
MDAGPTTRFFTKLKKVAMTLESETAKLQNTFENRNNDSDSETAARAMRAYHELNCEVGDLKGQIQEQLAQQKARENEVSRFIKACRVMEQRVTKDIQTVRGHWEKYGYQAPRDTQRPIKAKGQESDAEDEEAHENETKSAGGEGGGQEEAGGNHSSSPPRAGPPPFTDVLRTPRLSDFGLSEMQLKRALAGAEWCSEELKVKEAKGQESHAEDEVANENEIKSAGGEVGGQQEVGGNHSSSPPRKAPPPFTDVLRTPRLSDFGLSEMELTRALAVPDLSSDVLKVEEAKGQESDAEDEIANVNETKLAGGEVGGQEEAGGNHSSSPLRAGPPPSTDVLRTPRLSDFGLSETELTRTLAGAEWCSEVPPMPEMSLPHPSLNTSAPPPMPITPKCALRMDDDELQTPHLHDFGISEHTMCLNNDFTMDLLRKNVVKPPRPPHNIPVPPVNSLMKSLQAKDNLDSPEPPVFCTPGFKMKKTNGHCFPPVQGNGDPESPDCRRYLLTTPELPVYETTYMDQLISTTKGSEKMLQKTREHEKVTREATVYGLELDGPTQEFSLGTPRLRTGFQEPSTPEMPDISFITQDICKLVSQAQLKKTAMAVVHPHVRPGKDKNRAESVSVVSESEFKSLPSYLRQMTLYNLNQSIHNINKFMEECPGEKTEFHMEELRRITNAGTKTPVYLLCLTELKRLTQVGGSRNTSVYKLSTHN